MLQYYNALSPEPTPLTLTQGFTLPPKTGDAPTEQAFRLPISAPISPVSGHLTAREKEVIFWISRGKTDWQMAQILEISAKTVNFHVERIKTKLSAATRAQATDIATRSGLLV